MAEPGLDPLLPLGGTRGILPICDMAERDLDPLLPLRGGRATFCQKRDMAERDLDPLLPLGGDAPHSAKSVTWPSEIWTPYYPGRVGCDSFGSKKAEPRA